MTANHEDREDHEDHEDHEALLVQAGFVSFVFFEGFVKSRTRENVFIRR